MLKIYTVSHKRPDFIEIQLRCFQKYLQEPFEFVVFNNAVFERDRRLWTAIRDICQRLSLPMLTIQKDKDLENFYNAANPDFRVFDARGLYANANIATAYPLQWAWQEIICKEKGPICLLHSDMFLTETIKLTDYLQDQPFCFVPQSRPEDILYAWEGFVLLDMSKLPNPQTLNWFCGKINNVGVDVGGMTYHYLKAHPEVTWLGICPEHHHENPGLEHEFLWLDHKKILHYGAGSNWNKRSEEYHEKKTAWLRKELGL